MGSHPDLRHGGWRPARASDRLSLQSKNNRRFPPSNWKHRRKAFQKKCTRVCWRFPPVKSRQNISGFPELLTLHGRHSESVQAVLSCVPARPGAYWIRGGGGERDNDMALTSSGGSAWIKICVFTWISTCREEEGGQRDELIQKAASLMEVALLLGSPWQLMPNKQLQP